MMRYAFGKSVAQLANSPLWITTVVGLFAISAGLFEFLIHRLVLRTGASPLAQSLLDAAIVGVAAAFAPLMVLLIVRERHRKVLDDLRRIAEVNHRVRNALQAIVYNEYLPRSEDTRKAVLGGVDRIDNILQELFPVVGDRTGDVGWKVVSISGARAFVPDRRRGKQDYRDENPGKK